MNGFRNTAPIPEVPARLDRHAAGIDHATTASLAFNARDADQAYRIRYDAYHASGNLDSQKEPIFCDKYDSQPNFRTALIFKNNVPAATVRIGHCRTVSPARAEHKLPAMEIFGAEIEEILTSISTNGSTPTSIEIGRLARSPAFDDDNRLVFALFRVAGYIILHLDADVVLNAVRVHHIPMYRRFGFRQFGEPRLYPGLTCNMALMACFRSSYDSARSNLPFLRGISKEDAAYAGLIAGERVAIFGDAAPMSVRPAVQAAPLSQRPDVLRNCA